MNDKRFRKYWSFSLFLSLLGMFELEAKEEEKEGRKTERRKDKKKNAQHTLGKVTTQAAKIFNYNNQTTISSKELERRQANQISDMFRRNPNINVGGGAVIAQKIYVRGIEDRLARVTVDGAAQMGASYGHQGNTIIDPGMLKSVVVTKGAAQASAGPMALIGAIKMETRSASDFIPKGKDYAISGAVTFLTNFGDRETVMGAYRNNHFDILLYYTHQNIFYYRDGDNATKDLFRPKADNKVTGSPSEQNNVMAKINGYLSERDTLTLSYNMTRDNANRPLRANFTGTFLPYSCGDFNAFPNEKNPSDCLFENDASLFKTYSVNLVHNVSLNYEREGGSRFGDPKLKINGYTSIRNVQIDPLFRPNDIAAIIPFTPNPELGEENECVAQGGIYDAVKQTCSITFKSLGGGSVVANKNLFIINSGFNANVIHTIDHKNDNLFEYGLNYQNLTTFDKAIPNSELVKPGDAPDACLRVTGPNDPNMNGRCQRNGATANVVGVYAQANYTLHPMVTLGAGTRYDVYTLVDKDWQLHITQGFSPSAALNVSPLENLNFRLSYAYVTRGPMPGGLVWMRQDNLRYNRNLKPEIGQNVEFNTEYSSQYFDFRAAGFVQLISNYINQFSSTLFVTNLPAKDIIYVPGYEVSGTAKYKGFSLGLSVARSWPSLKGRLIADVYELVATTGNVFILTASYTIPRTGLSITWLSRFVTDLSYCSYSPYRNGPTDIDRRPSNCPKTPGIFYVHKPGYGVSSFFITYKPTYKKLKGLSLNAVFNNVFNQQYIDQASPVMSPDEPNQDKYARGMAEPGFNARFEISYKF